MLSVFAGIAFIWLVYGVVRFMEDRKVRPYFLAYGLVILPAFYGVVGFTQFFGPLLQANLVEGVLNAALYLTAVGVTWYGLTVFKEIQVETA